MRYYKGNTNKMTEREFNDLIERYLQGKASPSEEKLINNFFNVQKKKADPEQESIYGKQMWASIQNRLALNKSKEKRRIGRVPLLKGIVFLILMGVLGGGAYEVYRSGFFEEEKKEVKWLTMTAQRGQKSVVTLSDGTIIRLNSESSVSYPEMFAPDKREIILTGEAFFEVAKNPKRPFIVHTGNLTTKVLGTSFNIQAFPNEKISVTVATGRVEVTAANPAAHEAGDPEANVILTPNLQAVYDPSQQSITTSEVDIEKYLAWKNGVLKFEDASLEELSATLERWYDVKINFDNERIKRCRINGQYKNQSLRNVLESVQYMYKVDFKFTDQKSVLFYGHGCN